MSASRVTAGSFMMMIVQEPKTETQILMTNRESVTTHSVHGLSTISLFHAYHHPHPRTTSMPRPTWWISQVIPPALLTYFGRTLYICFNEIGPSYLSAALGYRSLGRIYSLTSLILIPSISILFLKLYFLPSNQSLPPRHPPASITRKSVVFECLSPAETKAVREANDMGGDDDDGEPLVNRCWRGKCGGRWKPARARHCSECGVCRMGFDHHCSFVSAKMPTRARFVS